MSLRFFLESIEIDNTNRFDCKGRLVFPILKKELKFPYQIYGIVEFEKVYVLRIYPGQNDIYNENIFGISKITGEVLWQIEPIPYPKEDSPYTGLWKEGDNVGIYNWTGYTLTVEPETGKVLKSEFTK